MQSFSTWHCEGAKGIRNGNLNRWDSGVESGETGATGLTARRSKGHYPWIGAAAGPENDDGLALDCGTIEHGCGGPLAKLLRDAEAK